MRLIKTQIVEIDIDKEIARITEGWKEDPEERELLLRLLQLFKECRWVECIDFLNSQFTREQKECIAVDVWEILMAWANGSQILLDIPTK